MIIVKSLDQPSHVYFLVFNHKLNASIIMLFIYFLSLFGIGFCITFPPSPCPDVFRYEDVSMEGDRWYGELSLYLDTSLTGVNIRFTLDKPSHLLVGWEGNINTRDNKVYILWNANQTIAQGSRFKYRIMVKFNASDSTPPYIQTIHFAARKVCPPDQAQTLSIGHEIIEGAGERPDPSFESATDIWSDIRGTQPTTKITTTQRPRTTATTQKQVKTTPKSQGTKVTCGQVDVPVPLITQGQKTQPGQWPWHTAIYKSQGANLNYECGGSLVTKNKVITAAHCVTDGNDVNSASSIVVYLGKHKLSQFISEEGVQTKQVSKIDVHPNYDPQTYYGDIAILTLTTEATYNTVVRPVCLWEETHSISDILNKEGIVVGFGFDENNRASEVLTSGGMPVVSSDTCLRSYPEFYPRYTSNGTFCAGYRNGTSACNGDSGGGIVFKRNSSWYLRGIVSLSVARENSNICNPNYFIIFTDVAAAAGFINRSVKS